MFVHKVPKKNDKVVKGEVDDVTTVLQYRDYCVPERCEELGLIPGRAKMHSIAQFT